MKIGIEVRFSFEFSGIAISTKGIYVDEFMGQLKPTILNSRVCVLF